MSDNSNIEVIVLGGGCFWCTEAVFQQIEGVVAVESGYTGGKTENPTYKQICTGTTGHAEVVKISYNPNIIKLEDIFNIFFATHDPTTLNRQGADVGTQYRSVVFYTNEVQKNLAEEYIDFLDSKKVFKDKIVTEVTPLGKYYKAEDYHQNYYNDNSNQSYCTFVILPKLEKLKNNFKNNINK
jgi:methionine-S-sulfoxide reductase